MNFKFSKAILLVLICLPAFVFTNCGSDDDDDTPPTSQYLKVPFILDFQNKTYTLDPKPPMVFDGISAWGISRLAEEDAQSEDAHYGYGMEPNSTNSFVCSYTEASPNQKGELGIWGSVEETGEGGSTILFDLSKFEKITKITVIVANNNVDAEVTASNGSKLVATQFIERGEYSKPDTFILNINGQKITKLQITGYESFLRYLRID